MELSLCWVLQHWQIVVDRQVEPPVLSCCVHGPPCTALCVHQRDAWRSHAVTCTYLQVLHGQTGQLERRKPLIQRGLPLLLLLLLVLLKHHGCHFQQLGLNAKAKRRRSTPEHHFSHRSSLPSAVRRSLPSGAVCGTQ